MVIVIFMKKATVYAVLITAVSNFAAFLKVLFAFCSALVVAFDLLFVRIFFILVLLYFYKTCGYTTNPNVII